MRNSKTQSICVTLILGAALSLAFAKLPSAHADGATSSRSLAYLSVRTEISNPHDSAAAVESPEQAPKNKHGIFTESQAQLMRDLSKTIDVIPGGVSFCLNIHY